VSAAEETLIEAGRPGRHYWSGVWHYRHLLYFLSWRDIVVRYKQTVIGVAWAWLRPLLTMAVFTLVFSVLARLPSVGTVPYPLLVLTGLLPWQFFSSGFADAGNSLIGNERLITKVYFPRIVIPFSAVLVALADFAIAVVLLALFFVWYGIVPGWRIAFFPLFALMAIVTTLGPGLIFAALNVKYRDFRHVVPFVTQIGLYLSPVAFSSALVPEPWRQLYFLNPMAGVIEGFRWSLLGGEAALYLPGLYVSLAVAVVLLLIGLAYFRKTERVVVDLI
jgi:lipopolysaccharide transport system permease protein